MDSKKPIQVLKRHLRLLRTGSTGSTYSLRLPFMNNNFEIAPSNPPPPVPNHHNTFSKRHHSQNGGAIPLIMDPVAESKVVKVFASMENTTNVNVIPDLRQHEPLKNIANQNGGLHLNRTLTTTSARSDDSQVKMNSPKVKELVKVSTTLQPQQKSVKENVINDHPSGLPQLKLNGFVGFDSLPYQLVRKCHSNGFQFNLLCVGETGMGKTTLIESLFNMKVEFEPCNNELNTVELRTRTSEVCESGVRVKLRVVETAGFGDQLDKDKSAKVIVDYINEQFEAYLKEELKIRRCLAYYDDTRIHACLYFISPTGHGLKALDVVTMRELSKRVNVIPVIAKADTACKDELVRFKQKIISELKTSNIEIYQFPTDDEAVRNENAALNALLPFAIVGSVDFVTKEDGRVVRARRYPWGIVEVENEEHCDFVKLREAMLRINEDSLRDRTHNVLYERYRRERLQEMKLNDGDAGPKMMEATLTRQKQFKEDIRQREDQFAKEFALRVSRKEAELKHREDALNLRQREARERFEREMKTLEIEISTTVEEKSRLLNNSGNGKKRK